MRSPTPSRAEPRWSGLTGRRPQGMSPACFNWIRDPASLTRRLLEACDGGFQVRVMRQAWGRALPSEARLLRTRLATRMFQREVRLHCGDEYWVFARTLIPTTSFTGGARRLAYLGSKPLGAVLFADPGTERLCIEVGRLQRGHAIYDHAVAQLDEPPAELWGRRTLFRYRGHPVLVNEIFLPAIPHR